MNPLTNVRNVSRLNEQDLQNGRFDHKLTWHYQYKDSAYIFIGGLPYDLTEGDVLCVFSQYGEIININLVRDKKTGKSKGYAFLCYEDQRSTILAVDNFNGIQLGGRTIRVDHVGEYRIPKSDEKDEDGKYVDKIETGCAPKTPPSSSGEEENEHLKKKKKDKKKKKKKKKKKEVNFDSDGDIDLDQNKVKCKIDNKNHEKSKDVEKKNHYEKMASQSNNELYGGSKKYPSNSESGNKSYTHKPRFSRSPESRIDHSPIKKKYRTSPDARNRSRSPKRSGNPKVKRGSPEQRSSKRRRKRSDSNSRSPEERKRSSDHNRKKTKHSSERKR